MPGRARSGRSTSTTTSAHRELTDPVSDSFFSKDKGRWAATGTGTNAGVTVTKAAAGTAAHVVTGVQCSGDVAAVVTVESPAATVLWQKRFAGAFTMSEAWPLGQIVSGVNAAILVKVSASTSNCEANIQGIDIVGG